MGQTVSGTGRIAAAELEAESESTARNVMESLLNLVLLLLEPMFFEKTVITN